MPAASPSPPAAPDPAERPAPPPSIDALLALRAREEEEIGKHQRFVERATSAIGRPSTIYLIASCAALWAVANGGAHLLGLAAADPPPFAWASFVLALLSLLMTTMVLTTQNRQAMHADRRAQVDLQVNLLTEQKVAKLIALIEELRRDLPQVRNRRDSVAEAMTRAVDPEAVVEALDENVDK